MSAQQERSAVARREFLVAVIGAGAVSALAVREVFAQQTQNFAPMNQGAYVPVIRTPKPAATRQLTDDQRDALEKTLKCQCSCILDVYTCRTTDFTCSVSPAMHQDVLRLIDGGYTADEIRDAFVEVYGEVALTAPVKEGFNWLGYFAPSVAMLAGAVVLTLAIKKWTARAALASANAAPSPQAPTSASTDDELARLERAIREDS